LKIFKIATMFQDISEADLRKLKLRLRPHTQQLKACVDRGMELFLFTCMGTLPFVVGASTQLSFDSIRYSFEFHEKFERTG
jgi:hypothetical protein